MRNSEILEPTWKKTDFCTWKTVVINGREIYLVKVTPRDLGLKQKYSFWGNKYLHNHSLDSRDVAERGFELGLLPVSREVLDALKDEAKTMNVENAIEDLGVTRSGFCSPRTDFILGLYTQGYILSDWQGKLDVDETISSLHSMHLNSRVVFIKPCKQEQQ